MWLTSQSYWNLPTEASEWFSWAWRSGWLWLFGCYAGSRGLLLTTSARLCASFPACWLGMVLLSVGELVSWYIWVRIYRVPVIIDPSQVKDKLRMRYSGESIWVVDWVRNYSAWMIHQPLLAPFRNTIVSVEIYAVLDYSFAWSSLLGSFGSRSHTFSNYREIFL